MDEDAGQIEIVVPDDQLSLAIGRRGQNVRLASQLTGWDIVILTEEEESERRQEEFRVRTQLFIDALGVDDVLSHLLVTEGFTSIEEIAYVPVEDLLGIAGLDADLVAELRNRAEQYIADRELQAEETRKELGVSDDIAEIEGLSALMLVELGKTDIKTLDDLGDLSSDELISAEDGILREFSLTEEEANSIIMAARAHWFDDASDDNSGPDAAKA